MESAGAREALAKATWGGPRGLEGEDEWVCGCGGGAQGKAGAGEARDAELDSTERGGARQYREGKVRAATSPGAICAPQSVQHRGKTS